MRIKFAHPYEDIISVENLLLAWKEFLRGKRNKVDVLEFQMDLMKNILLLHSDLKNKVYKHGAYKAFNINNPKPRNIHKATVRDRLLHHAIYRRLYPFFDKTFISDSYSCRFGKGTHKAIQRFISFGRKVSKNDTRTCWILKCDIRKFFAGVNRSVLFDILGTFIQDEGTLSLLKEIVGSFETKPDTGLPLGNLTSQLLVNIYMNEFDRFVKHRLKVKYFIRYTDDFVFLHSDENVLLELLPKIGDFLEERLKLWLHPNKVFIKTLASGVDFLGWVHFLNHRVLRTTTKRRMFKKLAENPKQDTTQSYLGMLKYGNGFKIRNLISNIME